MPDKRRFYEPILSLKHVWEKREQNRIKGIFSTDKGWMVTFHSSGPDAGSLTIERKSRYHPEDDAFEAWRDQTIDNVCALLFAEKSAVMDTYTYWAKFRGDYRGSRLFAVRVRMARKPRILISDDDPQWKLLRPRIIESAASAYFTKHRNPDQFIDQTVSLAIERDKVIDECERREGIEIVGNRGSVDQDIVDLIDQKELKANFLSQQGRISITRKLDEDENHWFVEVNYIKNRALYGDPLNLKAELMTADPIEAARFVMKHRDMGDEIPQYEKMDYIELLEIALLTSQSNLKAADNRYWQNLSGENL